MTQLFHLISGTVDIEKRMIVIGDNQINLTEQESILLMYFIENSDRIISKEELLLEVWQQRNSSKKSRVVSQSIKQLRKKIGDSASDPKMLFSVYGQGYRFLLPEQPEPETPTNLPVSLAPFFGRKQELEYCKQYFERKDRMITILGTGGMGKTSLALQHANESRKRRDYLGGIYFCDLADAVNEMDIVRVVSEALNISVQQGDLQQSVQQIGQHINSCGSCLLILDNFEQLTSFASDTVAQWYMQSANAHFIITSRQRLGLRMEDIYELCPFSPDEALDFFIEQLKRVGIKKEPTAKEKEQISTIVQTLDCIPLALCLAASRSRLLSIDQIHKRLSNRFQLLRTKGLHPRQQTMQSAIDWSWNLLDTTEKSVLLQCAIFRGGFDLAAAESIVLLPSDTPMFVEDILQQLLDKSMLKIQRGHTAHRLSMYDSIRYYVLEKIPQRLHEQTQKRFQEYFRLFVLQFESQKQRHQALALETNNVQYAWQLLLDNQSEKAAEMLICFSHFFEIKGWYISLLRMIEQTMQKTPHDNLPPAIYYQQARVLWRLQHFDALEKFFNTLPTISDRRVHKEILNIKVNLLLKKGSLTQAEEEIQYLLQDGNPLERASTLMLLSGLHEEQFQNSPSLQCSLEALQIYTDEKIQHARIQVMGNLGSEFCIHGRLKQSKEFLEEALHYNRKKENRFAIALNTINLSTLYLYQHNPQEALQHTYTAISHLQALGNKSVKAIAMLNKGIAHILFDQREEAQDCLQKSVQEMEQPLFIAIIRLLQIIIKTKPFADWEQHRSVLQPTSQLTAQEWDQLRQLVVLTHTLQKHRKAEDRQAIRSTELDIRQILRAPAFNIPREPMEHIPNGNIYHRYCLLLIEHALGPRYIKRFQTAKE